MEANTGKQQAHQQFLETALRDGEGSIVPSSYPRNRTISTATGAELVALDAMTERSDETDKRRKIFSITETGRLYLKELSDKLINDTGYLANSLDRTLRSFHGGSSTGAFMLLALARQNTLYHSDWLKKDETHTSQKFANVKRTKLLRETIEQQHKSYSEQQARLLLLTELLMSAKLKPQESLLDFTADAQEPLKLVALKATDFDFKALDLIRNFFQAEQAKLTGESLEVSNSFLISASLLALASLIESIEIERLSKDDE